LSRENNSDDGISPSSSSDDEEIVTKEMFLRDLLETEEVLIRKKKSKNKQQYKVMDNRDNLPFAVQLQTPDPYTHPDIKKKRAAPKQKRRADAVEEQIASRLFLGNNDDNTKTLLGEFSLDKHTTTGDVLLVGGHEYKVVRHRCQYKYAGGKRFVMVRKILEVKEVGRLRTETMLQKQFSKGSSSSSSE